MEGGRWILKMSTLERRWLYVGNLLPHIALDGVAFLESCKNVHGSGYMNVDSY